MTHHPRARVIVDNDFSGDPDDLFQLAHHVLSTSIEIPFVIGSHLSPNDPLDSSDQQAQNAVKIARDLLALMGRSDLIVVTGSETALVDVTTPIPSEAARAIVVEALRDDTDLPLYLAVGGGLTDLASALLLEPAIADRMTVVWIGGSEYPEFGAPPVDDQTEYNLAIDRVAAKVLFEMSSVPLWQVPRDTYRQCLMSQSELDVRVREAGAVGRALAEAIDRLQNAVHGFGHSLGETYAMGDNPLVLLTALQSAFSPDTTSSGYRVVPAPGIDASGAYDFTVVGRPIRVYTSVDTRLMFEDLYLKLALHGRSDEHR